MSKGKGVYSCSECLHTGRCKACRHSKGRDTINHINGEKCPHFRTVSSQRHSWCCGHMKSDRSSWGKNLKRELVRDLNPVCFLISTDLSSLFMKWAWLSVLEKLQKLERCRGRGFQCCSLIWQPLRLKHTGTFAGAPYWTPTHLTLTMPPYHCLMLYEWLLQVLSSCLICESITWLG